MSWWRRKEREQDLDRELRSHLDLETEEQEETGLSSKEARYAAQSFWQHNVGEGAGT